MSYKQPYIFPWCNGNTAGFGPAVRGSNPCGKAKKNTPGPKALGFFIIVWFLYDNSHSALSILRRSLHSIGYSTSYLPVPDSD